MSVRQVKDPGQDHMAQKVSGEANVQPGHLRTCEPGQGLEAFSKP